MKGTPSFNLDVVISILGDHASSLRKQSKVLSPGILRVIRAIDALVLAHRSGALGSGAKPRAGFHQLGNSERHSHTAKQLRR